MSPVDSPLRCDLLDSYQALASVRTAWDGLCDRCPSATPFQRPDWLLAWTRQHRFAQPWSFAVWEQERLLGLAPLHRYRRSALPESPRVLAFLGAGVSDYLDLLIAPRREATVLAAILAALAERRSCWEFCELDQLRTSVSALTRTTLPPGWSVEISAQSVCPALSLPERLDELGNCVPSRQLQRFRKYRRRAARAGALTLERATPHSCDRLLDALFHIHELRWRQRGEPEVIASSDQRQFLREAATGFAARGALALYGLHLDERVIACVYGLEEQGTLCFYLGGFDPEFAQLSPGMILFGLMIEDAVRRGLARVDFLRGNETYKYGWGAVDQQAVRVRLLGEF